MKNSLLFKLEAVFFILDICFSNEEKSISWNESQKFELSKQMYFYLQFLSILNIILINLIVLKLSGLRFVDLFIKEIWYVRFL